MTASFANAQAQAWLLTPDTVVLRHSHKSDLSFSPGVYCVDSTLLATRLAFCARPYSRAVYRYIGIAIGIGKAVYSVSLSTV